VHDAQSAALKLARPVSGETATLHPAGELHDGAPPSAAFLTTEPASPMLDAKASSE
jgi:hypothetical protein